MKPTAEQALRGIQRNLLEVVLPAIGDTYVRGQVQQMAAQVQSIADAWESSAGRQREAIAAMELLLARTRGVLPRGDAQQVAGLAAAAPTDTSSPRSLEAREDALTAGIEAAIVELERIEARAPAVEASALRGDIYRFLRQFLAR